MTMLQFRLPFPPSVNHYWRSVDGKMLISKAGRQYRKDVAKLCMTACRMGSRRLSVEIAAYPPDRRRRDLDNLTKALLDSLEKAGVYDDDGQIDRLLIERGPPGKPGFVTVTISG